MQRRYLYVLLYAIPALIVSLLVMVAISAALAAVLWLFVFGDNPWPPLVDRLVPLFMVSLWVGGWAFLLILAFQWGKRQEANLSFNPRHAYLAGGITLALLGLIALHQISVGNIGPQSEIMACVNWCSTQGFTESQAPGDGMCHCHDIQGDREIEHPVATLPQSPAPTSPSSP